MDDNSRVEWCDSDIREGKENVRDLREYIQLIHTLWLSAHPIRQLLAYCMRSNTSPGTNAVYSRLGRGHGRKRLTSI
jgi:hypothetical protein